MSSSSRPTIIVFASRDARKKDANADDNDLVVDYYAINQVIARALEDQSENDWNSLAHARGHGQ